MVQFLVIYTMQIHKNVETVQKYMLEGQSELKKALISVPTLHLTLMVMNLASKEDIAKCVIFPVIICGSYIKCSTVFTIDYMGQHEVGRPFMYFSMLCKN